MNFITHADREADLIKRQKSVMNQTNNIQPSTEEQEETSKMAADIVEECQSEEVFTAYRCSSIPPYYGCGVHPGNIVEAASLAAQSLPLATYNVMETIPVEAIREGLISDLQLEGILFACQRHQLILPDGNRAGFFLGDGTGVGKGRQIAGIILDNFCRGRRKHIWFSISSDLRHDAVRDLTDIGCYVHVIDGCQQLDNKTKVFGLAEEFQEGVIFSTYSTLISSSLKETKKASRLDQLIKWCGKDYDGCLIFDECHKAKHFIPGKEKASTKIAVAVTQIQRLLPKARVLYCSATGVTDVKNLAFMERLGLWGPGTMFTNFEHFLDSLTRRGLGALEMLSMEIKAAGMYISRGLSYHEAEFHTVEATLTAEQIKIYNKAVHVWNELRRALTVALGRTRSTNSRIWRNFWGCHQRFFKQLCISMKVPVILEESRRALKDGYCVVIGLQTTGEASLDSELDQNDGNITGFVSLTREILKRFIYQFFPTEPLSATIETKPDEWCCKAKSLLLDFAEKMELPNSPLDEIIDELGGPNNVAEMTGRKGFIGRYSNKEKPRYFSRGIDRINADSISVQEKYAFMKGDKLVAIISDAASTGISLHADKRANNQRRRVHITAELPWSADKAVQQLGRSHRSNQISGPIYKLITSNLGGERRFAAAVARRLQSLGALTKGDRRAATGVDLIQFNVDTPYGRQSLKLMYDAIAQRKMCFGLELSDVWIEETAKYSLDDFHDVMKSCLEDMAIMEQNIPGGEIQEGLLKDVGKFLNRILGLDVDKQNLIFNYFSKCLSATTEAAKREGRYNDGMTDVRGNSLVMCGEPSVVFKEAQLGSSITNHAVIWVDRGIPFDQALQKYKENERNEDSGFYRSKRDQYGRKLFLLALQKERSNHLFNVTRPNTGMSPFEEEKIDLWHKYDRISPEDAEMGWTEQYEKTKDNCIHGDKCKYIGSCKIGSRTTEIHLLMGRILSILPALEKTVSHFAHSLQLPREHRTLRVVRMELDNGTRLVGLRYPHILFCEVEKYIKEKVSSTQQLLGRAVEALIEKESKIDSKSKAKAFTKPRTIKNFFKSSSAFDVQKSKQLLANPKDFRENQNLIGIVDSSLVSSSIVQMKPLKRTSSNISKESTVKRRKQSNIFNIIHTQNQKKILCPVCQKSLAGLANSDVNKHIDLCLIE